MEIKGYLSSVHDEMRAYWCSDFALLFLGSSHQAWWSMCDGAATPFPAELAICFLVLLVHAEDSDSTWCICFLAWNNQPNLAQKHNVYQTSTVTSLR